MRLFPVAVQANIARGSLTNPNSPCNSPSLSSADEVNDVGATASFCPKDVGGVSVVL